MNTNNVDTQILSIEHNINERKNIISNYVNYKILDREDAISKIKDLRLTDSNVAKASAVELAVNAIPFAQATNEQLVAELQMQVNVLSAELTEVIQHQS